MDTKLILDGIRVVEAATMVFVPSAAAIMSDFGAEVIKIEGPGAPDPHRNGHQFPGMPISEIPYVFEVDNRNKKGLVLNLKDEEGYAVFEKLIAATDVFMTNYRPAALKKLRISYEDLKPLNPRLIFAHGMGYGEKGLEANNPSYDMVTYWSRSGVESQMFPADGFLGPIPYGPGVHPSGLALLNAILLALYDREKTGRGAKVSSTLLRTGAWTNSNMLMAELAGAEWQARLPREETSYAFRYHVTADRRIIKININDFERLWGNYCRSMGLSHLIEDPRFAALESRTENIIELNALFDAVYPQHDAAYWLKTHEDNDIPCSLVQNYQEVASDPQMAADNVFVEVDDRRLGRFRTVDSPLNIEGQEKIKPCASPQPGEHTIEILKGLGYSEVAIQALLDRDVTIQK